MKSAITKKGVAVHIFQALIWATGWLVMLWMEGYPLNEWVGVVGLGYLAWYVSYILIDNAMGVALARVYGYAATIYGERKNKHALVSKRMELVVAFLANLLIYGVIITTSGFMFILTWLGLVVLDFPALDTNIKLVGLISVTLGSIMMILPLGAVIYILSLSKNRLYIRERFMNVSALAWASITKERFMSKLGFGLNYQYIERSTV